MKKLALALVCAILSSGCGAAMPAPGASSARLAQLEAEAKRPVTDIAKARKWVATNSGGSFWDRPRKHLFPSPDDGEGGTRARAFADAEGKWFAGFVKAWTSPAYYLKATGHEYDPTTDLFVAVETSDDEPVLMVGLFDRKANKGRMITEIGWVDIGSTVSQAAFHGLFPKLGNVKDVDYSNVSEALFDRGTAL